MLKTWSIYYLVETGISGKGKGPFLVETAIAPIELHNECLNVFKFNLIFSWKFRHPLQFNGDRNKYSIPIMIDFLFFILIELKLNVTSLFIDHHI